MDQKERNKIAELIRNNPELPVFCKMDTKGIGGEFLLPIESCRILNFANLGDITFTKNSLTEDLVPEEEWKPAICLIIPNGQEVDSHE